MSIIPYKRKLTLLKNSLNDSEEVTNQLLNTSLGGKYIKLSKDYAAKVRGTGTRYYRKNEWDGKTISRSDARKVNMKDDIEDHFHNSQLEKDSLENVLETFIHNFLTSKIKRTTIQKNVEKEETRDDEKTDQEATDDDESTKEKEQIKDETDDEELENRIDFTKNSCLCFIDRILCNMTNAYKPIQSELEEGCETILDLNINSSTDDSENDSNEENLENEDDSENKNVAENDDSSEKDSVEKDNSKNEDESETEENASENEDEHESDSDEEDYLENEDDYENDSVEEGNLENEDEYENDSDEEEYSENEKDPESKNTAENNGSKKHKGAIDWEFMLTHLALAKLPTVVIERVKRHMISVTGRTTPVIDTLMQTHGNTDLTLSKIEHEMKEFISNVTNSNGSFEERPEDQAFTKDMKWFIDLTQQDCDTQNEEVDKIHLKFTNQVLNSKSVFF
ncbi:uncharacterized protein BX663DRAFT_516141 [Cokeromyces recurvatus]|uniref:uncharacterized protein n=1 Tax=Cokeromyces recurvatus TaxID=90255 RepID=UPI002220A89B|nr:uncharacterized protein BX663DRAFT_516141 [Cokeromyces recurvatus]KAI7901049.1 hypothetical protein BX663DRAFT_516141 [Cokeromyces recurvatus]